MCTYVGRDRSARSNVLNIGDSVHFSNDGIGPKKPNNNLPVTSSVTCNLLSDHRPRVFDHMIASYVGQYLESLLKDGYF